MIKQNFLKMVSGALCCSMIATSILPVFAATTDTTIANDNGTQETEVLYNLGASFFVTIPKTIVLGNDKTTNYAVKVEGDISSDQEVYVAPIDQVINEDGYNFYMKDQSVVNPKLDVLATTTQNKTIWNFEDVANGYEETNNEIKATNLSSGSWKGTFDFEINMKNINEQNRLTLSTDGDVVMGVESNVQVNAYIDGKLANDNVTWSSDNENITVTNGLIETTANAQVGDTATITVTASTASETSEIAQALSNMGLLTIANAANDVSIDFVVTIIDIEYSVESIEIAPGESASVTAKLIPNDTIGTVSWSQTSISGVTLIKNENEVTIKVAEDMEVGKTFNVMATFRDYSKALLVKVIAKEGSHTHSYTSEVSKEATCTEVGEKTFTCECGDSYTEEIAALGHIEVVDEAKKATCTETGLTEGKHCSVCDEVLLAQEIVATLEHNYENGTCKNCGDVQSLEAGLYDANGTMLCSWEESGIDVEKNYNSTTGDINNYTISETSAYYVLTNNYPTATKVVVPNSITSIGKYAFSYCENVTDITIPNSVTSIGVGAFASCEGLTNIIIPEGITSIKSGTFSACYNLKNVTLPEGITSIGNSAFVACTSLTSIIIPDSVTSIDVSAFRNCYELGEIKLSESLTSIKASAFEGCSSLSSIEIPDSVINIGDSVFNGCTKLTNVIIGSGVTSIGKSAFAHCEKLENLTIPNNVTNIGGNAFLDCTSLTSMEIPDSITSIEASTFKGCKNLASVILPSSVTSIGGYAFSACYNLTDITIPEGITILKYETFAHCESLTNITIPSTVTHIEDEVFEGCTNLTKIIIPSNVKRIGTKAFYDCSSLTSVTFKDKTTWYVGSSAGETTTQLNVTNTSTNATYLKSTYYNKYWTKK